VKILLDECIDRRLAKEFIDYEVKTVPQMNWAGIKNGELMRLAEAEFDVFITVDRNLSFQQNLPKFNIAVVVLRAKLNRLPDLLPFAQRIIENLPNLQKGKAVVISLSPTNFPK
jgi:Domain of unknown function (DUF5615)